MENRKMLIDGRAEQLAGKAQKLLEETGMLIENEAVMEACRQKGCKIGADRRVKIPGRLIEELVAFQKKTQKQYEQNHKLVYTCGPDWAHYLVWTRQAGKFRSEYKEKFLMQAFDCGPTTYYDHSAGLIRPVNAEIFDMMMKFAEATPEIGNTSMWYRQDVPPQLERLTSLRRSMDLTAKFSGIEAIFPEVVKYLKEASEILTGDQNSSAYLAGSECITMPLVLEQRSAEDILERKKRGVNRYHIASMPTLGMSTPATLAAAIVMGAAEILGGMVICWCVDPESDISGRMIALIADMRNGNSTSFGPYFTQGNNAVRRLFDKFWGGHCMVEVFFSPTARKPGLQAVFENYYGTSCRRRWEENANIPYAGMGTLFNGGLGSPTQFILDMEIRKAEWAYKADIPVDEESLDFDEVIQVTNDRGNFLASEHTMRHCRELWTSPLFRSDSPFEGGWDGTEKAILDKGEEIWRENLKKWQAPAFPSDKIKAMDNLLARAQKEFGGK
jgi:trimethylamine:corrinoid methyltransferase-like protein